MATSATAHRLANAAAALALAGPAVLLGAGVAWADPSPAPADGAATNEAPAAQPSVGSWIIGGTLLEGSAATPAKPAAKPAAKPVAKPAAVAPARTSTRTATTTTRTTSTRTSTRTTRSSSTAPAGATALPFTGNHVDALLPAGVCFLAGGVMFLIAGRPRRVLG